jgi:hypothetical protein
MVSSHSADKGMMWPKVLSMIARRRGLPEVEHGDDRRGI